jgi:multiple antibiotic resistance protein
MEILDVPLAELFILLFIAMGPIRITMNFIPLARDLPAGTQRRLAWRTVWVGLVVALIVVVAGQGVVRNFGVNIDILLMAGGVAFTLSAVRMLSVRPNDTPPPPPVEDPLRLAISPLAVPGMISPLAVAMLLSVAAFVPEVTLTLVFLGLVVVILALNLGAMLVSPHLTRYLTIPILEIFQQIFGFILLALGINLVLEALATLQIISMFGI